MEVEVEVEALVKFVLKSGGAVAVVAVGAVAAAAAAKAPILKCSPSRKSKRQLLQVPAAVAAEESAEAKVVGHVTYAVKKGT